MKKRVFRIIQYEGDAEWVERQVNNSIHGTITLPQGSITAVTIGEFGEQIEADEDPNRTKYRDDIGRRLPGQIAGSRPSKDVAPTGGRLEK